MGWGTSDSDGESSQSPSAQSSAESSGGWGSSGYASQNSSQMSGGYQSNGGSSSGSGWGGQSTANPSITGQYGGGSSSGGSSSNPSVGSSIQSRVESKIDGKGVTGIGDPASLTGQGLAGAVAAPEANYWSGATDGWRNNTNYTDGKAGQFGTREANAKNIAAINNKTAHEGQIETAKAQVAGWNTVNARDSVGGLLGFMGNTLAGPVGGYAAGKAASFGAEKVSDYTSGFKDNPAYNESKRMTEDDSSIIGSIAGKFSPAGTGGIVSSTINDAAGDYRQDMVAMQSALRSNGHISTPASAQAPNSSNSSSGSLLVNMTKAQPAAPSYDYSPAALNYGNFYSDMGSTI